MDLKFYKVCRVKCKHCGDVLEYVNQSKEDNGPRLMMVCKCGRIGLDAAALAYRVMGADEDFEDLSEEWTEEPQKAKVRYYWTEDGEAELCDYEKITIEKEERCEHCDNVIPVGECVKLTTWQGSVYWLHNHCAKKGVDF